MPRSDRQERQVSAGFLVVPVREDELDVPYEIVMSPREYMKALRYAFMRGHTRHVTFERFIEGLTDAGLSAEDVVIR